MSFTAVKEKGLTVVTVASDSESMFPPLCQILRSLCCSPKCCSVHAGLMQTNALSALGTVQIMVGLFNVGLGPGRISQHPEDLAHMGAAYWLGGVYIAAGLASVLADRFPSLCLVGFAAFVNIVGSIAAIVGIVLYAMDLGDWSVAKLCDWGVYNARRYTDHCENVAYVALRLLTAMDITMIVLAVLQLCVCISVAVLSIKALFNRKKDKGDRDVEIYQPLLNQVLTTSSGD